MTKDAINFSIEGTLKKLGIDALNEMQIATIDACKKKSDILLISPTGTGKTLAYLLPILERLKQGKNEVQAVILVPTRELALQIESIVRKIKLSFSVCCCYGGHSVKIEKNSLTQNPDILIATPGRLADHLNRGHVSLRKATTLVIDEFDKSLELGFEEDMEYIMRQLSGVDKKILTSATEPEEIPAFTGIKKPIKLQFLTTTSDEKLLQLKFVKSPDRDKYQILHKLLCNLENEPVLVFCNHREAVERASTFLTEKKIIHEYFHGGLEQVDREKTLAKLRNGSVRILISTDLASRGLDIPEIKYVVHLQLAPNEESFIHRNGRTARMHANGTSVIILHEGETIPEYIQSKVEYLELTNQPNPAEPEWETLFIGKGRKDKMNKVDIVGFLSKKGNLNQEEIGLIEVKDFISYVAVKRSKTKALLSLISGEKIKGNKVKIQIAR
ncbi:MAG: DEAD/DEAH box helicase [Bacteroidia bacterium]|nr:DEAD/DEAH box helicase [Bacteroidia bacterium]